MDEIDISDINEPIFIESIEQILESTLKNTIYKIELESNYCIVYENNIWKIEPDEIAIVKFIDCVTKILIESLSDAAKIEVLSDTIIKYLNFIEKYTLGSFKHFKYVLTETKRIIYENTKRNCVNGVLYLR